MAPLSGISLAVDTKLGGGGVASGESAPGKGSAELAEKPALEDPEKLSDVHEKTKDDDGTPATQKDVKTEPCAMEDDNESESAASPKNEVVHEAQASTGPGSASSSSQ